MKIESTIVSRFTFRLVVATLCLFAVVGFSRQADAQTPRPVDVISVRSSESRSADRTLTAAERTQIIDRIAVSIRDRYVFPEVGDKMVKALRKMQQAGQLDVAGGRAFAAALTNQLQSISRDKHLVVSFSPEAIPTTSDATWGNLSGEERDRIKQSLRRLNYGFRGVQVLDGNIGYLNIIGFAPAAIGWDTVESAMRFVSDTDALIIDVRDNPGGSMEMVSLLCSYLLNSQYKSVHINDVYSRLDGEVHQFWTLPYVPGKRYADKPVYVLTSRTTFSSAEELAYDLKVLGRATLVGEVTAGGAHVGADERINDHFSIFLPSGRSVNPVTKTNWEGVGVTPDQESPAAQALQTAHRTALRKLMEGTSDSVVRQRLQAAIDDLDQKLREAAR